MAAQSDAIETLLLAERFYTALLRLARGNDSREELSVGGRLLYVGELDLPSRAMVVAANVAGAATLAATADVQLQKQAIRSGVVDFLVTSLDEALRILKNEIRKRERVAVCVGVAPAAVEREMLERGVQPNLMRAQVEAHARAGTSSGITLTWSVDAAPAHWLPMLDVLAIECLSASQSAERRWLRNAPRHLGRAAFSVRVLSGGDAFAARFADRVRAGVENGDIQSAVTLRRIAGDTVAEQRFTPHC